MGSKYFPCDKILVNSGKAYVILNGNFRIYYLL